MDEIIINKAITEDLNSFYDFFQKKLKENFSDEYTPRTIAHFIEKTFTKEATSKSIKNCNLFLAKDGKKIVGFLFKLDPQKYGVDYTDWLVVDEDYRGRGIGSNLLKAWEKDALKKGAHCLMIMTEQRNVDFYKKRGFIYMGRIPKGWAGAEDIYFYKPIQEPKEENYLR